jgi:hypothetical protein
MTRAITAVVLLASPSTASASLPRKEQGFGSIAHRSSVSAVISGLSCEQRKARAGRPSTPGGNDNRNLRRTHSYAATAGSRCLSMPSSRRQSGRT